MNGPTLIAGRYALGRLLGTGGMAQVFQARDQILGRDVAVKLFGPAVDAHGPDRVQTEMRTLAGLSHPSLVTVHDAGTDTPVDGGPERAFLVMELIDGPTVAQLIAAGPLAPDLVAWTGAATAAALAYAHSRGVMHRDVKPGNILLDTQGRAHLADFGIAQTLGQQALTATGLLMGTAPYLSPEQVQGQQVTTATDVYSLGLVLLEALTGRREYPGTSAEAALARLSRPPVVDAGLPEPWPDLLTAMTATDPDARPDAAQVADVLSREGAGTSAAADAASHFLGSWDEGAPTEAAANPTRVMTQHAAPAAPGGRRRTAAGMSGASWAWARRSRPGLLIVASVVGLVLLAVAVASAIGSVSTHRPAPVPTVSPTSTVRSTPSVRAAPTPTRSAAAPPSSPGKGHGRPKGK